MAFFRSYNFLKLVDFRARPEFAFSEAPTRHILTDIDKTYLETKFETFYHLVRTAFEKPEKKLTVPGASEVLCEARWQGEAIHGRRIGLHFVSSSPPQLRGALQEKFLLDDLDWDSDTLKNQIYNIFQRRLDQLRQHIVYKSAAILKTLHRTPEDNHFILIGDSAESDAFIYMGVFWFASRTLTPKGYQRYLEIAAVEPDVAKHFVKTFQDAPGHRVDGLLIRNAPGYKKIHESAFGRYLFGFENYLECALALFAKGYLTEESLWRVTRAFINLYDMPASEAAATYQAFDRYPEGHLAKLVESGGAAVTPKKLLTSPDAIERAKSLSEDEILEIAEAWMRKVPIVNGTDA